MARKKIEDVQREGKGLVTLFECEASALLAVHDAEVVDLRDELSESIEYSETVDAMLDGIVPAKDKDGNPIWLKERVGMLLKASGKAALALKEHLEYDGGATCDITTMMAIIEKARTA